MLAAKRSEKRIKLIFTVMTALLMLNQFENCSTVQAKSLADTVAHDLYLKQTAETREA